MPPPAACRAFLMSALFLFACGFAGARADEPGFRRFVDTISPDGAFVLAWGTSGGGALDRLKEWAAGTDTADGAEENFLVDAALGKVVATIPEQDHYVTSGGRSKQFSGLAVNWSDDSRHAVAIYEGRWSAESIVLIDAPKRSFIEVLGQLNEAYAAFLRKTLKVKDAGEISFNLPVLLPGSVLVIGSRARPRINQPLEYNHILTFRVKMDGEGAKLTLLKTRKASEPQEDEKVEDELNKTYQQLRAKLDDAGRAALKEHQLRWLRQRETLPENERNFFTRMRAASLRARAEN